MMQLKATALQHSYAST